MVLLSSSWAKSDFLRRLAVGLAASIDLRPWFFSPISLVWEEGGDTLASWPKFATGAVQLPGVCIVHSSHGRLLLVYWLVNRQTDRVI